MKRKQFYIIFVFVFVLIFIACILFCGIKHKDTIAIIGAMDEEISEIRTNLENSKIIKKNDFVVTKGTLGNNNIVLIKSGVGKVAASSTTQFIIDNYKPIYIVNIGIAGSLSPDIKVGDIIVADKLVQHDFDVTAFGNPKGYIDNGTEPNKPTIFNSDKKLVEKFKKGLELNQNKNIKIATIATGDIFVNKEKQKQAIRDEFKADAIDMESAAIAQTTRRNNVPLIVIRTISDSENNSVSEYKQNKKITAAKAALSVLSVLNKD